MTGTDERRPLPVEMPMVCRLPDAGYDLRRDADALTGRGRRTAPSPPAPRRSSHVHVGFVSFVEFPFRLRDREKTRRRDVEDLRTRRERQSRPRGAGRIVYTQLVIRKRMRARAPDEETLELQSARAQDQEELLHTLFWTRRRTRSEGKRETLSHPHSPTTTRWRNRAAAELHREVQRGAAHSVTCGPHVRHSGLRDAGWWQGAALDARLLEEIAQLGHGGAALTGLDLVVCARESPSLTRVWERGGERVAAAVTWTQRHGRAMRAQADPG